MAYRKEKSSNAVRMKLNAGFKINIVVIKQLFAHKLCFISHFENITTLQQKKSEQRERRQNGGKIFKRQK